MRRTQRVCWFTFGFLLAFGQAKTGAAQALTDGEPREEQSLEPPKLIEFVPAEFSAGEAPSESTSVLTEVTIDEQGRVIEVKLVEPGEPRIDAAVLDAIRRFVFEPARRDGTPVSATIRYRYVIEGAPREPPEQPAPEPPVPQEPAFAPTPEPSEPPIDDAELEEFSAVAEVEAPPHDVTRRSMGEETLTRIPGTRGDALRAIEVMPGVARTGTAFANPLLRGAAWNESATYLDGVPVPFLFHFGGLTSFMNSRLIERVDVMPSNFSTRFGRVSGGIVEVHTRDPAPDGLHGVLDLNLIDSSVMVEAPVGPRTAVAGALRRSNIDFFFETFADEDSFSVVAAPVYWDYQALATHRLGKDHRLRGLAYGSRDSVKFILSEPNEEDPALSGDVGGTIEFHRVQLGLRSALSETATQDLVVALGVSSLEFLQGGQLMTFEGPELHARGEWSVELLPELRMTTGLDVFAQQASGHYRGTPSNQTEGDPTANVPVTGQRLISLDFDNENVIRPGGYLDFAYHPHPSVQLVPGLRVDYYKYIDAWSIDPRLSARHHVTPTTTLKSGTGLYSQPPEAWQAIPGAGNPDLDPFRAWHTSLGVEQVASDVVKLGVEGFYKRLWHRIVAIDRPPYLVNDGEGRVWGAEFSLEVSPDAGFFGYGAYTLSRSERRDRNEQWRLFDQDQTHILTLAGGVPLGRGWEVGARFRLVSGNPSTPIVSAIYDAKTGVYVPDNGPLNSERDPTFHQLDLRVEKQFQVGTGKIAAYLDLQNAYNAENPEGVRYSYDYQQSEPISGMPIFPNLGLRGEL